MSGETREAQTDEAREEQLEDLAYPVMDAIVRARRDGTFDRAEAAAITPEQLRAFVSMHGFEMTVLSPWRHEQWERPAWWDSNERLFVRVPIDPEQADYAAHVNEALFKLVDILAHSSRYVEAAGAEGAAQGEDAREYAHEDTAQGVPTPPPTPATASTPDEPERDAAGAILKGETARLAHALITGDRAAQYGDSVEECQRVAWLFNVMRRGCPNPHNGLTRSDVPYVLMAVKLARQHHREKTDNLVDLIGYADIASHVHEVDAVCEALIQEQLRG